MDMITHVFKKKGDTKSVADAFINLVNLNPNDKYKKQKASGSLGGSIASGFLSRQDKIYTQTREGLYGGITNQNEDA